MKNYLLLFLLISLSLPVHARWFEGYYVTNESDTIKCKFNMIANKHYENIDFANIGKTVSLIDERGKEECFAPPHIAGFVISNPNNGETYKFVSLPNKRLYFFQEIIKGRISLYKRHYYYNVYAPMTQMEELFIRKSDKLVRTTALGNSNRTQKLLPFLEDNPEVAAKWAAIKYSDDSLKDIIEEYNSTYTE